MKTIIYITLSFLFTGLFSCAEKPKPTAEPASNIPVILEGKRIDVSRLYTKNKENLIESLYQELISKSEELKSIDAEIKSLNQQQQLALDSFRLFNDKNQSYYESAKLNINNIKDSIFRQKVLALVNESVKEYNNKIAPHQQLDSLMTRKTATINDLYILLKVVTTLPAMHNFQLERLPGTTAAESFNKQLDSLQTRLDSLSKKLP